MSELATSTGVSNPMVLIQPAIEKGMDVDKLGKLLDLQERWEKNRAAEAFSVAIKDFQAKMPAVEKKQSVGNQYTYASHEDIMAIAQPILDQCGIVLTFGVKFADKLMETTCNVRVGIHVESTTVALGLPAIPNANNAQMAGAAISYGQRYAMKAALNIRVKGEDKDGAGIIDEPVNEQQVQRINNLLESLRRYKVVNLPKFMKWLGEAETATVEDIPQSKYKKAVAEIELQIRELQAKSKKGDAAE